MKMVVIGGSGFIGTRFISIEKENKIIIDKVINQNNKDKTKVADIRNKDILIPLLKNIDLVVHLAAEHRDDVHPDSLYYDVNVKGTENILAAMDINGIKNIIFTSSVAIYGLNKKNPIEDIKADPFNHYGKSKWQAECLLKNWYNVSPKERSVTIIRPTVVFGENNRGNVYNLLRQIVSGRFLMIGNGKNLKSMAYVGNVASFIDYCSKNLSGYQVYNYTDKPDMNMNDLVKQVENSINREIPSLKIPYFFGLIGGYVYDLLGKITSKSYSVSSVRVKKFCATTQFDSTKAHSSGFNALYKLSESIDKTLKYEFKDMLNNDE